MNNDQQEFHNSSPFKRRHLKQFFMNDCWQAIKDFIFRIQQRLTIHHSDANLSDENALNDPMLVHVQSDQHFVEQTTLKDWIKAVDGLILQVQSIRKKIQSNQNQIAEIDFLSVNAYLYHLDRLLVMIRENYLTLRYREEQFNHNKEILSRIEFFQCYEACIQCYQCIIDLGFLLEKLPESNMSSLYSEDFVRKIHALEIESNALASAMRTLNHFAYRQEAVAQLTKLEQDLFETFVYSRSLELNQGKVVLNNFTIHSPAEYHSDKEYLRSKLSRIARTEDVQLINRIIDVYDVLRRCYVVARKAVIKETLESMAKNIEGITQELEQTTFNKEKALYHLHQIFNNVEALRFSSNRESRCSRHLFEKARAARKELRRACLAHPIGCDFLKEINIPQKIFLRNTTSK